MLYTRQLLDIKKKYAQGLRVSAILSLQYSDNVQVKKTHALEKFGEKKAKMLNANVYMVSAMCKREGIIVILCEIASLILTPDLRD